MKYIRVNTKPEGWLTVSFRGLSSFNMIFQERHDKTLIITEITIQAGNVSISI